MIVESTKIETGSSQALEHVGIAQAPRMSGEKRIRVAFLRRHRILDTLIVRRGSPFEVLAHDDHDLDAQRFADRPLKSGAEADNVPAAGENLGTDDDVAVGSSGFLANPRQKSCRVLAHDFRPRVVTEIVQDQVVMRTIGPKPDFRINDNAVVMALQKMLHGARASLCRADMEK